MNDLHIATNPRADGSPPTRVYQAYYQLNEPPFAITPDPEFLFFSKNHQEVLDKIIYAIECRLGFILLIGEVGTGKTTLCRALLDHLHQKANTIYIINPSISSTELLRSMLEDLGYSPEPDSTKKELLDQLNQRLLREKSHLPTVVIIDDAQTMATETLEDLRLLSNLETDKEKLIQVVLSGQPELLESMESRNLRQLRQRIAIHCRLTPLPHQETEAYIFRRLSVAGNKGQIRFAPAATRRIYKSSKGVPRHINRICDFALTAGYIENESVIGPSHVKKALIELRDTLQKKIRLPILACVGGSVFLLAVVLGLVFSLTPHARSIEISMSEPLGQLEKCNSPEATGTPPDSDLRSSVQLSKSQLPSSNASMAHDETLKNAALNEIPEVVSTNSDALSSDRKKTVDFALQLGSFRTLKAAQRSIALYKGKGIACHWQALNGGKWYRVITGKFDTAEHAARYKAAKGLQEAMIINAPFTVRVMPENPHTPSAEIANMLVQIGYDCQLEVDEKEAISIYTGVFSSKDNALQTAKRINKSGHLVAQVVQRQQIVISEQ